MGRVWGDRFLCQLRPVVYSGVNTQLFKAVENSFTLISEGFKELRDGDHCLLLLKLETW